ncbi:hypothetical protein [Saccharopolyspora rectivirgula]|jgi:hypothetical protein|nr:hypothetical protein [Saccharopolyspora rectivirgula]
MLRACEFVFLSPSTLGRRKYRRVCREMGLEPSGRGYGVLLCVDQDGNEVTKLTTDPSYLSMAVAAIAQFHVLRGPDADQEENVTRLDGRKFELTRAGWPTQLLGAGA